MESINDNYHFEYDPVTLGITLNEVKKQLKVDDESVSRIKTMESLELGAKQHARCKLSQTTSKESMKTSGQASAASKSGKTSQLAKTSASSLTMESQITQVEQTLASLLSSLELILQSLGHLSVAMIS